MQNAEPLENLADQFARFPGIGRKGAVRMAYEVMSMSNEQAMELALIENLQRADLTPIEEARGYQQLIGEYGLTQEQVADRVSKSRPAVAPLPPLPGLYRQRGVQHLRFPQTGPLRDLRGGIPAGCKSH